MKKFNRFDFEQQIMQCWHVTDDIRTVTEYLLDAPLEDGREDKIANMLMGIEALYEAKFDKLFQQFESLVHEHARTLDRVECQAKTAEDLVGHINLDNLQQEIKL
jgi:hypothetical protein